MAISSNRSTSPISSRTNLDSRKQENSSGGVRKSFGGNSFSKPSIVPNPRSFNPVTPANSPAELSRRNTGCKEGIASLRGSYECKENEKDQNLKHVRVKEPSISKGTKSFMAPTISAISKITPSPKKKVLAERNETVRSSVSDSDGKSFMGSDLSELAENQNQSSNSRITDPGEEEEEEEEANAIAPLVREALKNQSFLSDGEPHFTSSNSLEFSRVAEIGLKPDAILNSQVPSDTQNISESLSERKISDSNGNDNANLSSKVKPFSSPLAPLDSDPHLPPYDPKTNYLSPRPRFLHYKPKPRIEVYLNKELDLGEVKRLEDSFTSESCSDTENTEETQSSDFQKDLEEPCSSEILSVEDKNTHISETEPAYTHEKEIIQFKGNSKSNSRSFVRSKIVPFLLVFVIACLYFPVIDSPVLSPSGYKVQTFKLDGSAKIAELVKANLDGLTSNIKLWSSKTVSYLSTLISISREGEELGSFYFSNFTVFNEQLLVDDPYQFKEFGNIEPEDEHEQIDTELEMERESEEMPMEEEIPMEEQNKLEIQIEEEVDIAAPEEPISIDSEEQPLPIPQTLEVKIGTDEALEFKEDFGNLEIEDEHEQIVMELERESEPEEILMEEKNKVEIQAEDEVDIAAAEKPSSIDFEEQSPPIPQSPEVKSETHEAFEFQNGVSLDAEPIETTIHSAEDKFPAHNVLGICSVLLTLVATATYFFLKREKGTTPVVRDHQVKQFVPKKLISRSISTCDDNEQPYQDRLSSRNWPTEVDMVGESCPSEISSSFKQSLSYGKSGSEVQSYERKLKYSKRESLASPSEYSAGSPSYGSFTTYEKVYGKHGCGEEEVVTPVRRSSRIRKKVTSP